MPWIKRNLFFVAGGFVALVLAAFFLLSNWQKNKIVTKELKRQISQLTRLSSANPQTGTVNSISQDRLPAGNEIPVTMLIRGVNLDRISPTANKELAYMLEDEVKKSGIFAEGASLGDITVEKTAPLTFAFKLTAKLKKPFKL